MHAVRFVPDDLHTGWCMAEVLESQIRDSSPPTHSLQRQFQPDEIVPLYTGIPDLCLVVVPTVAPQILGNPPVYRDNENLTILGP